MGTEGGQRREVAPKAGRKPRGWVNHRRTDIQIFKNSSQLRHNQTEAENKLWQILCAHRFNDIHFRRQHAIGPYIVDFGSPQEKLIIELDGGQHLEQQE